MLEKVILSTKNYYYYYSYTNNFGIITTTSIRRKPTTTIVLHHHYCSTISIKLIILIITLCSSIIVRSDGFYYSSSSTIIRSNTCCYCNNILRRRRRPTATTTTTAAAFLLFGSRTPRVTIAQENVDVLHSTNTGRNNDHNSETCSMSASKTGGVPVWFQHQITITAPNRGCHLITSDIQKVAGTDIKKIAMGMCNLFIQHTSASLTINENADPDVRRDMEVALNKIVPAQWNRDGTFLHTMEGDDDMPGHVKSSIMGVSLNIPIRNGKLALGTWQGIYLNEHRDQGGWGNGHARNILITLQGQTF